MSFFLLNFVNLNTFHSTQDDAKFVRAIADFQNPAEPTLLKFKKGDIIAISKNKNLKIAKGIVLCRFLFFQFIMQAQFKITTHRFKTLQDLESKHK